MKKKPYVKISKIGIAPNAAYPTPAAEEYIPGEDNGAVSLPINYTIEGYLVNPIKETQHITVQREKRNGIPVAGFFSTSEVEKITKIDETTYVAKTLNSVYNVEYLSV